MPKKISAQHVADAAVLAAKANHYLVCLKGIREEEASAAYQLLIDMENSGAIMTDEMDRAKYLLEEAAGIREGGLS